MKKIRQTTVVEQLMQEIRKMITDGAYKTNQKIPTESELAQQYNVGRSSVREAIKTLSHLGVLESHTSQGTYVSENNRIAEVATAWSVILGYDKIKEVFELGTALDTQVAIALLNGLINSPDDYFELIVEINGLLVKMRTAANANDLETFTIVFADYFSVLYGASSNMVFIALNECIDSLIVKKVCSAFYQTGNLLKAVDWLERIWNSILERSMINAVKSFQDYGVFVYGIFAQCNEEEMEAQAQAQ